MFKCSVGQPGQPAESWSSWALSWMPSIVPLAEFDDDTDDNLYSDSSTPANNTVNIGFYIDTLALALKVICDFRFFFSKRTKFIGIPVLQLCA